MTSPGIQFINTCVEDEAKSPLMMLHQIASPQTELSQHFKEERPRYRVKRFHDVQLEKKAGLFLLMKKSCYLLDQHEI